MLLGRPLPYYLVEFGYCPKRFLLEQILGVHDCPFSIFIISLPPLLSFQADNQGAVPHDAAKFSHGLADVPPRHRQL